MKTNILKVLLIAILFLQGVTASLQQSQNDNTTKRQIILFDGKSTNSWRDIKSDRFPDIGWVVTDGVLTVLAKTDNQDGGQDIVTKEQFSSFELELEIRLSEGANSGIKYLVTNTYPDTKGQYLGLEYQLIDNEKHPDALLGRNGNRKMAALYDILPARDNIKVNPPGEWNKVRIVVDGNRVEHWLNGEKVIEYDRSLDCFKELVRISKYNKLENFGGQEQGHILLQGHGNEVSFRDIKITIW